MSYSRKEALDYIDKLQKAKSESKFISALDPLYDFIPKYTSLILESTQSFLFLKLQKTWTSSN